MIIKLIFLLKGLIDKRKFTPYILGLTGPTYLYQREAALLKGHKKENYKILFTLIIMMI